MPAREEAPERPEPVEMPAARTPSHNLWEQLRHLSGDQKVALLVDFEDIEGDDGDDYDSNPYGGR